MNKVSFALMIDRCFFYFVEMPFVQNAFGFFAAPVPVRLSCMCAVAYGEGVGGVRHTPLRLFFREGNTHIEKGRGVCHGSWLRWLPPPPGGFAAGGLSRMCPAEIWGGGRATPRAAGMGILVKKRLLKGLLINQYIHLTLYAKIVIRERFSIHDQ